MELETENQTNIDYNKFFYATVCHICKQFGDDVPLKRCSGCKKISYCGTEHQKQHWAEHKPLCKAIRYVLRDGLEDTPDDWIKTKFNLINKVGKKKGFLDFYEMQVLMFTKECAVCYEQNVELLVDCRNCAVSFCKDHKDGNAHRDACEPLKLYFHSCLSAAKKQYITIDCIAAQYLQYGYDDGFQHLQYSSNTDTKTSNTFEDMNGFINTCWNTEEIEESHSGMYNMLIANLSESLTRPLTLFHAMQVLNYVPKRKEIVIHVVSASHVELNTLKTWEVLLHFIIETEVSLTVIMIGRELECKSHSISICDKCLSEGKKVSFEFYNVLYEDYVRNPLFVKPDLIVGFNVDVQEYKLRCIAEMTELSIQMLAKQNCPFLLTFVCDGQEKLEKYTNNINTTLNRTVDYLYSGKNPFASLSPNRWSGERLIIYYNNFIVIYRSLCP